VTRTVYVFTFQRSVPLGAVEDALVLAAVAAEALHDDTDEVTHLLDHEDRTLVLDARTARGNTTLRVFLGFVTAVVGEEAFRVVTAEDLDERHRRRGARCSCRRAKGVRP
jgi:hypothetical protein